mgnify:CR=1 FL=1
MAWSDPIDPDVTTGITVISIAGVGSDPQLPLATILLKYLLAVSAWGEYDDWVAPEIVFQLVPLVDSCHW